MSITVPGRIECIGVPVHNKETCASRELDLDPVLSDDAAWEAVRAGLPDAALERVIAGSRVTEQRNTFDGCRAVVTYDGVLLWESQELYPNMPKAEEIALERLLIALRKMFSDSEPR
jgi:hypothetical protein